MNGLKRHATISAMHDAWTSVGHVLFRVSLGRAHQPASEYTVAEQRPNQLNQHYIPALPNLEANHVLGKDQLSESRKL